MQGDAQLLREHREWVAVDAGDDTSPEIRSCMHVRALVVHVLGVYPPPRPLAPLHHHHAVPELQELSSRRQPRQPCADDDHCFFVLRREFGRVGLNGHGGGHPEVDEPVRVQKRVGSLHQRHVLPLNAGAGVLLRQELVHVIAPLGQHVVADRQVGPLVDVRGEEGLLLGSDVVRGQAQRRRRVRFHLVRHYHTAPFALSSVSSLCFGVLVRRFVPKVILRT
mmetsp:Transcript_48758/g.93270  ORF Transcript_48758/g.93270 Transcript_48758/m.93270 type:complete len:222 (+) Transcript_48758:2006-2671(+)